MPEKAEDKVAQHVVTSENRAEFTAKRLDLVAPEAKTADVSHETTEQVETKTAEVTVHNGAETTEEKKEEITEKPVKTEEKKAKPGIQERFSELTAQREAAKSEARAERDKREALERQIAEQQAKVNPPKVDEAEPDPNDAKYKDDWRLYAKDLAKFETQKALSERDKQESEARTKAEADKIMRHWTERQNSFKAETEDYAEAIAASTVVVSNEVRDAIIESDVGPQLLYHLAKNPSVAEKISGLSVRGALRELGRLEAKLETPIKEESTTVKKKSEVIISKAPSPISPLKGANNPPEVPINAQGEFTGTYQEWKTLRKAGKIK